MVKRRKDKAPPRPTDAELAILRVLWDRGPSTVADVREALARERETGYTTVLKLMQIMTDKKLVVRDETRRAHVYDAALPAEQTQQQLVGHLMERAFAGSASGLVLRALESRRTSPEEMKKIRELLDKTDGG